MSAKEVYPKDRIWNPSHLKQEESPKAKKSLLLRALVTYLPPSICLMQSRFLFLAETLVWRMHPCFWSLEGQCWRFPVP
jgi:hypothetical protein